MVFSVVRPTKHDAPPTNESRRRLFNSSSTSSSNTISKAWTTAVSSTAPGKQLSASAVLQEIHKDAPNLRDLNQSLVALAAIFPAVRVEVFREMLTTFSGESRLQLVAEQLLRHEAKWVNGRWRVPTKDHGTNILKEVFEVEHTEQDENAGREEELVPIEETFRTNSYKRAVKAALYAEFKTLSKSTVDGVVAEQNFSYTMARPILLGLAAKSWRINFSTLLTRWRKDTQPGVDSHYMLVWSKPQSGPFSMPSLRETGDVELTRELESTLLKPLLEQRVEAQEAISFELATLLNEQEAEKADAMFECQCCFGDTTFEQMATCSTGGHQICFNCIQRGVSEALYGQSWPSNINHTLGQVACLAPIDTGSCTGCIPHHLSKRAIESTKDGTKTWQKLESRLAEEALLRSSITLIRCPFCPYAEANDIHLPPSTLRWRLNSANPLLTLILLILTIDLFPLLLLYTLLSRLFPSHLTAPSTLFANATTTLVRTTHLSPRFSCRNPTCKRVSCLTCAKPWRDPHTCYESATLSLRTTIEAARTAALKRTCPRCGVGFVKESGCNKMVCVCGYAMCYVCREGLSTSGGGRGADGEGYRHFCQHFRPAGGKCGECERCDLYREEDGDEIVRRAGERAEREWRKREGLEGGQVKSGFTRESRAVSVSLQGVVDWWVKKLVRC